MERDIRLLQEFLLRSSEPYLTLCAADSRPEKDQFQLALSACLRRHLLRHPRLAHSLIKVLRAAVRSTALFHHLQRLPHFAEVDHFRIPPAYRIEGCFLHAMNALMEFSEAVSPEQSLAKLQEVRRGLGADVDEYYKDGVQRKMDTETQLEILKFMVAKLKTFLSEIYAQLKYLEVIYGEDDMAYKYDDASYLYAQLSLAIHALAADTA